MPTSSRDRTPRPSARGAGEVPTIRADGSATHAASSQLPMQRSTSTPALPTVYYPAVSSFFNL